MDWAASHLVTRRMHRGVVQMEGFHRKKGGAKELLGEKRIILKSGHLPWGQGRGVRQQGFMKLIASSSSGKWRGPT